MDVKFDNFWLLIGDDYKQDTCNFPKNKCPFYKGENILSGLNVKLLFTIFKFNEFFGFLVYKASLDHLDKKYDEFH